jgi:LPPG:FO 2-phospho-L-lactate transferase
MTRPDKGIVALCGGVGGAKLAYGLNRLLGERLTVVVNTGDDFDHLGLAISPDLDTVVYTLGELADEERGWGRAGESWNFMKIPARILPMTDHPFATIVVTTAGRLPFQRYFVELQARPEVQRIEFDNHGGGAATAAVLDAIAAAEGIIVCPSNPYLSIDPILAVPGIASALEAADAPIVAVSPLVGGQAVKGPTAKIMNELGVATNCASIVKHYPFLDGLVIDSVDEAEAPQIDIPVHVTGTVMRSKDDRIGLAAECLKFLGHFKS